MRRTIEIDIETDSRIPQGWAPWVGSSGLDPQALHTYSGSLLSVGSLADTLQWRRSVFEDTGDKNDFS